LKESYLTIITYLPLGL